MVSTEMTISFDNADLFSSATITATAGGPPSTATAIPSSGGNSPEVPNSTVFTLVPPLVIPGGMASYTLVTTISNNPGITMRRTTVIYATMIPGDGVGNSGGFLASMLLLSLGTIFVERSRPRRMYFALVILMLALTSQVGCDNGSVGSSPGSSGSGVPTSTQTAKHVKAANMKNEPVGVIGFPIVMSTIRVP